jgi:hypothetical protein
MGRKFLTTITLPTLSSAPSSPSIGDMYFDTTLGKIGVYTSSGWVYLSDGSGGSVDLTNYARKSENEIITGNWTFSSTTTFSATPTFSAGLTISGGVGTWTTGGWTKAVDLLKGQALVWRTGGGLAIGLGVNSSSNTLYLSSSTADDNSATVSYPIVFDVENGRIGIGTTTPSERLYVNGNIKVDGEIIGPESRNLVIRGGINGVEIRVDEGDTQSTSRFFFKVTQGPTGSRELFVINASGDSMVNGYFYIGGSFLGLGINRYDLGNTGASIALEKIAGGILAINREGDFYGGVRVEGPGMTVTGNLTVNGTITGSLSGNASTATKLQTARNISLGGSLSGSTPFDGSANVTINASINAGAVGTNQLADNAVTTVKIADGSVTYAKLAQDVIDLILGSGGTRIFQTTIGDGTNSTYTVTHNFNSTNVEVSLTLLSTNEKIGAKVEVLNSNQIRVSFISPIASNSVRVIVIG